MRHWTSIAAVVAAVGCAGETVELVESANGVTRSRHGDTIIVRTERDGVWGPARDAEEVLRANGGSRETTFGSVTELAATADGGVIPVDAKSLDGPIVRQFDSTGAFVRNIGRPGNGPGEYSEVYQIRLATARSGAILLRDGRRGINRYAPDGRFVGGFPLFGGGRGGSFGMSSVLSATDGSIYASGRLPFGSRAMPPMLHFDSTGRVIDSLTFTAPWLPEVDSAEASRFTPRQGWAMMRDGRVVVVRSDRLAFLIVDPEGRSPPLIGEVPAAPVPFLAEERAELEAAEAFMQQNFPPDIKRKPATIPEHKLPMRGFLADLDGRVWLYKSTTGEKGEPRVVAQTGDKSFKAGYTERPVLVAFNTDGTFLGELRFPLGVVGAPTFVGNTAWAIVPDDDGVPVLVKFRLHD